MILLLLFSSWLQAAPIVIGTQKNLNTAADQGRQGSESWKVNVTSAILVYDAEKFNKDYTYSFVKSTTSNSVTLDGIGSSWTVWAQGGEVMFNIGGDSNIYLRKNFSMSSKFDFSVTSPSINIVSLTSGATAFVFMDGVK
ncbi:MAG: hypothetical protein A3F67_05185 [Verrucomicrobia bacterium RIFCSPHIGHO2_12_FULL_41_10]|nr:MAG: hypothetical protein A3F67_05185 [Verrucomicrobia bacterium RIFCSPHIGHO2_12_FULL_41_10]